MIGGDQLTAARIRGCKRLCSNGERGKERLDGLTALVEDWHASGILLTVSASMIVYILKPVLFWFMIELLLHSKNDLVIHFI